MAEINFNQVYDGVTLALHRTFPKAHVHGGVIKQDLKAGDFTVLPITASHTEQMGTRAQHKPVFDVIYYPSAEPEGAPKACGWHTSLLMCSARYKRQTVTKCIA